MSFLSIVVGFAITCIFAGGILVISDGGIGLGLLMIIGAIVAGSQLGDG